jgi:hypothetical protein
MIYLIIIILLLLAFIFDAERDTIQFRPSESWFPKSKWWTDKWTGKNPILKTVFVFAMDGWHFCKTMYLWCIFAAFSLLALHILNVSFWWLPVIVIVLWGANGLIFELTYGNKFLILLLLSLTISPACTTTRVIERVKVDTIKVASPIIEDSLNAKIITDTLIVTNKVIDKDTVIDVRYYPIEKKFYIKAKPDTVTITKIDTLYKGEVKEKEENHYIWIAVISLAVIALIMLIVLKK